MGGIRKDPSVVCESVENPEVLNDPLPCPVGQFHRAVLSIQLGDTLEFIQFSGACLARRKVLRSADS